MLNLIRQSMLKAIQQGRKEGAELDETETKALRSFYRQRLFLGEFLGEEKTDPVEGYDYGIGGS